jgi:SET domain-containing protein
MELDHFPSYTNPKLEVRPCPEKGGWGVFAREFIPKGELLSVWGGAVYTEEELDQVPESRAKHGLQVEEGIYLLPLVEGDPGDYYNHSCDPNAALEGQICLVAFRDILPDEEVCFDYAMSDGSDYDEFECHCGAPNCRKIVTGNDWMLPELQQRYAGHFIPYLQKRIDALRAKSNGHKGEEEVVFQE